MEWALYHPEWGYYTSDRKKIGKEGDFYTAPSVNPVFAEVLADEVVKIGSGPAVIEFGAGEGRLARDMLSRFASEHPEFYQSLDYFIVEISPSLREVQQLMVGEHASKVRWVSEDELQAGSPYEGVILTNELVDAYPVHRVTRTPEGLREVYVELDGTSVEESQRFSEGTDRPVSIEQSELRFVESLRPLSDPALATYVDKYAPEMIVGQTIEVGLAGLAWYQRALSLLSSGHIVTIDYGYEADMLHHSSRRTGTLRGFYRHTLTTDPYQHIGVQDLTADVNFSALRDTGEERGWSTDFFGSQAQYLLQAGILTRLTNAWSSDPFRDPDMKRNRAIKSLILPGGLGEHFKVLVQSKPKRYNEAQVPPQTKE
nr:SAM-dependent methyltransferase [Tumebacillus amylolyticus]